MFQSETIDGPKKRSRLPEENPNRVGVRGLGVGVGPVDRSPLTVDAVTGLHGSLSAFHRPTSLRRHRRADGGARAREPSSRGGSPGRRSGDRARTLAGSQGRGHRARHAGTAGEKALSRSGAAAAQPPTLCPRLARPPRDSPDLRAGDPAPSIPVFF